MSGIDMELGDEKEEHGTGGRWFSGGSWNECEGRGDVCESNDERTPTCTASRQPFYPKSGKVLYESCSCTATYV